MAGFQFPPPPPPPPQIQPHVSLLASSSRTTFYSHNSGACPGVRGRGRGRNRGFRTQDSVPYNGGRSSSYNTRTQDEDRNFERAQRSRSQSQGIIARNSTRAAGPKRGLRPDPVPSVPQFGAPFPTAPTTTVKPEQKQGKRKTNLLGLTPSGVDCMSSEEDDVDEESFLGRKVEILEFAHKGSLIKLDSPSAIRDWIEMRRKNWPTAAKADAAQAERSRLQEEAMRRRSEHKTKRREPANSNSSKLDRLEERRQQAPSQAAPLMSERASAQAAMAETDDESVSSSLSTSTVNSTGESCEMSASDSGPEVVSRADSQPIRVPASSTTRNSTGGVFSEGSICKNWFRHGTCLKLRSNTCHATHPLAQRASHLNLTKGAVLTLGERLLERQLDQDAERLLAAIKSLAEEGLIGSDEGH